MHFLASRHHILFLSTCFFHRRKANKNNWHTVGICQVQVKFKLEKNDDKCVKVEWTCDIETIINSGLNGSFLSEDKVVFLIERYTEFYCKQDCSCKLTYFTDLYCSPSHF